MSVVSGYKTWQGVVKACLTLDSQQEHLFFPSGCVLIKPWRDKSPLAAMADVGIPLPDAPSIAGRASWGRGVFAEEDVGHVRLQGQASSCFPHDYRGWLEPNGFLCRLLRPQKLKLETDDLCACWGSDQCLSWKCFIIQNAPWADLWQSLWFENLLVSNWDNIACVGFRISQIFSCNM